VIAALLRILAWLFGAAATPAKTAEPVAQIAPYRLHVPRSLLRELHTVTAPNARRGEPLAFLRVRFASEESRTVIVGIGVLPFPDTAYVEGHAGANFDTNFAVDVANQQIANNAGLLLVHSHGGSGMPAFSGIDTRTNRDVMCRLAIGITVVPYGAMLLSDTDAHCVLSIGGNLVTVKVIAVPDHPARLSVTA
jgi:hypothetical protein